jgi:hypothetical protein
MANFKKFLPHLPTIIACALIVAVGIIWTVHSSPGITTIGENISTGNISATNIFEAGTPLSSKYIPAPGNATTGDILYFNGTGWARLGTGESGQFLQSQGAGSNPQWAAGGGIKQAKQVIVSEDQSTATTTEYVDLPGASTSITTTDGNYLLIFFNANSRDSFQNCCDNFGYDIILNIDGNDETGSLSHQRASRFTMHNAYHITYLKSITPGSHTVKVRFKCLGNSLALMGNTIRLLVLELKI